nr:centrosomal protein of 290 kDa-like isoform X1 [Nomia melanderi]
MGNHPREYIRLNRCFTIIPIAFYFFPNQGAIETNATMNQEEGKQTSGLESCTVSSEKLPRILRSSGSDGRDVKFRSQAMKRRIDCTPQDSPLKHLKTPDSRGSFRKDVKLQCGSGSSHRKSETPHYESMERMQKVSPGGKFVNTLLEQWSKYTGVQNPFSQTGGVQDSPIIEEMKRKLAAEERKVQVLQKKLKTCEEAISCISASREAELQAKEEIFRQLNSDWESITNYYSEISESLKRFQEYKDNLYKLYNNVIATQVSTVKTLQEELNKMRLRDEEKKNVYAESEKKTIIQEKRIQEMMITETELKKQLENVKSDSTSERNRLHNVHAEEKLELLKKQEKLTSTNEELQGQLKNIAEEKQNLMDSLKERDKEISVLQEDVVTFKNKIEDLLSQTTELNEKYERSVEKVEEYEKELEFKMQEINRLKENLNTRQELEVSLAKDLDAIENKYQQANNDFTNVQNKLKDMEGRNAGLQRSIQDMKNKAEHKAIELNKKIEFLEKEKEKILSEKHIIIQDLENSRKLLKEKYEAEITALRKEFDTKLSEIKFQTTFMKLNNTLNKMDEGNQTTKKNETKENQNDLNERAQLIIEDYHTVESRVKTKRNRAQTDKIIESPKTTSRNESEDEEDIYSFTTQKMNNKSQKVSDHNENVSYLTRDKSLMQLSMGSQKTQEWRNEDSSSTSKKKKIFKTRDTGLRQYAITRKSLKK